MDNRTNSHPRSADNPTTSVGSNESPSTFRIKVHPSLGNCEFATRESLERRLASIRDPELGVSVVELGLVYEMNFHQDKSVEVEMTLTSLSCPMDELFREQFRLVFEDLDDVSEVFVNFVATPSWNPIMMSERVRDELLCMGYRV